jgi:RNA polymerase sigma-70 factor (ECF subfamily)
MTDDRRHDLAESLPALLRFARSLTRDPNAADDLVQDTVVRALERHHHFDETRSYRAWLLTLTHNLFVDGWRRTQVQKKARPALEVRVGAEVEPNQEHSTILQQTLRAFETLPADQRSVLHLVVVEGASYAEASTILNVPVGTIMSRLSRARAALRNPAPADTAGHLKLVSVRDD